jgi:hypothetical protein
MAPIIAIRFIIMKISLTTFLRARILKNLSNIAVVIRIHRSFSMSTIFLRRFNRRNGCYFTQLRLTWDNGRCSLPDGQPPGNGRKVRSPQGSVPANGREGFWRRSLYGKCHRKYTAWKRVRVKRCGKSAPRQEQSDRQGKPHVEQDQIGEEERPAPWTLG